MRRSMTAVLHSRLRADMNVDVKDVYNGGSAAAQYQMGHVVRPFVIVFVGDSLIVTDARPLLYGSTLGSTR